MNISLDLDSSPNVPNLNMIVTQMEENGKRVFFFFFFLCWVHSRYLQWVEADPGSNTCYRVSLPSNTSVMMTKTTQISSHKIAILESIMWIFSFQIGEWKNRHPIHRSVVPVTSVHCWSNMCTHKSNQIETDPKNFIVRDVGKNMERRRSSNPVRQQSSVWPWCETSCKKEVKKWVSLEWEGW